MKKFIAFLSLCTFIVTSCKEPCIKCEGVSGFPNGTICKDTYETSLTNGSQDWAMYSKGGVTAGCEWL